MQLQSPHEVTVFSYPPESMPSVAEWESLSDAGADGTSAWPVDGHAAPRGPADASMHAAGAEELRRSFEAGREAGFREGRQAEQSAQAEGRRGADQERMRQMSAAIQNFDEARDRHLQAMEREVVELALAIAARILRREAQMDPLLLTGAARVALGQLSESTDVRLKVPPADLDLWKEAIAHLPNLSVRPTVVAGAEMRLGDCVLETELGSVDLGVRAQLGEIERGFFDRAGRAAEAASPAHGVAAAQGAGR